VVDEALPVGQLVNAAAVLAAAIATRRPEVIGADLADASGYVHPGLLHLPLPILAAPRAHLGVLATQARAHPASALLVVGFSAAAQRARTYGDYAAALARTPTAELDFAGLALCGDRARVASLTGSLRLVR
jgi:hypothetical protein